jgi:hypothetical protein
MAEDRRKDGYGALRSFGNTHKDLLGLKDN